MDAEKRAIPLAINGGENEWALRKSISISILALVAWTMVVTAARGIRTPNDFSEAHWLIDYGAGFMRRGLVGSAMRLLSDWEVLPLSEATILTLSVMVFVAISLMFLGLCWRVLKHSSFGTDVVLVAVVFASSPFIVLNAHLMGYFDHLVIPMSLGAAHLVLRDRCWLAGLLMAVAVLIHEGVLFTGFPLFAFALYLRAARTEENDLSIRTLLPLGLPIAVFLVVWFSESILLDRAQIQSYLTARMSGYEFIGLNRATLVPQWLLHDPLLYLQSEGRKFSDKMLDPQMLPIIPTGITMLVFVYRRFRIKLLSVESLAVSAATLFPLAMHVVAWDTPRIWCSTTLSVLGIAWLYCHVVPQSRQATTYWFWLLALCTLAQNIFASIPLMDFMVERYSSLTRLALYGPALLGLALVLIFALRDHQRVTSTTSRPVS